MPTVKRKDPVGQRIRELRRQRGWTQEQLAGRAGIQTMSLSRIELGTREPLVSTVRALAQALGVKPGRLFDEPTEERGEAKEGRPRKEAC